MSSFTFKFKHSTINDWLTWTASITTAPDPPSNLSIDVESGKVAFIGWDPPETGGYSGFKLKVSENESGRTKVTLDS